MEKTQDNNITDGCVEVGSEGFCGYEDITCGNIEPRCGMAKTTRRRIDSDSDASPFLIKLYKMVNDKATHSIISWGSSSTTFIIFDERRFILEILPSYFKTSRLDSFISQLNNYGFKKTGWKHLEFEHEHFQEGKQHLLKTIKRRNQQSKVMNNMPSLCVPTNKLKATFGKVRLGQKQIVTRIQKFKYEIERTISDVQTITDSLTQKLVFTFSKDIGRKRKFVDFDPRIDFTDIEKDLESIYDQFEALESNVDDFTTLRDLTEKVASGQGGRGGGASGSGGTSRSGDGRRVAPFLHKLYDMVEKQEIDHLISWSLPSPDSFIIWDINKFATNVLPMYFNHTNFSSFNSQLNIYGFKKVSWERHEYANEWFRGGRNDLLSCINRREKKQPLMGLAMTCSSTEIEMFKNRLETIQQEQENKVTWLSYYEEEMKISVDGFRKMVINMANIANKMISKSNENPEHVKKAKLVIEDNGSTEEQDLDVNEVAEHQSASKDNNNMEAAESFFQGLGIDLDAVDKYFAMDDTWIIQREITHYLSVSQKLEVD